VWAFNRASPRATGLARPSRLDTLKQRRVDFRQPLDKAAKCAEFTSPAQQWTDLSRSPLLGRPASGSAFVLTRYGNRDLALQSRRCAQRIRSRAAYREAAASTFYSRKLMSARTELGLIREDLVVVYPNDSRRRLSLRRHPERAQSGGAGLAIREPQVVLNVKRLHELAASDISSRPLRGHRRPQRCGLVICGTGALKDTLSNRRVPAERAIALRLRGLVANDEVARYAPWQMSSFCPRCWKALPTVCREALAAARR
jgi:hypothetical protein